MDYTVGSLSDLITGTKSAKKFKAVKQEVSPKNIKLEQQKRASDYETADFVSLKEPKAMKVKVKGKKRKITTDEEPENKNEEISQPRKKKRKRNVETNDSEKSKNDVNAERRVKKKIAEQEKHVESPENLARTVFVGNLPISAKTEKLKKLFAKYGNVESVRVRGVTPANPKTPKKVAMIKKEFHPERITFYAFVKFETEEEAEKALEANGVVFKDHHLRVHLCNAKETPDESKAIFVGNLSFNAEEEELWQLFAPCGPIAFVRIVRDSRTGMGKGFGYVNFKSSDSVQLALEMENVQLKNRDLRISLCNINAAKKNKKLNKTKKINQAGKPKAKKFKKSNPDNKTSDVQEIKGDFKGKQMGEKKKKNKPNKGMLQKKKIMQKLIPKSKV